MSIFSLSGNTIEGASPPRDGAPMHHKPRSIELVTRLFVETQAAGIDAQKGDPPQRETFRRVAETVKDQFFNDAPKREWE